LVRPRRSSYSGAGGRCGSLRCVSVCAGSGTLFRSFLEGLWPVWFLRLAPARNPKGFCTLNIENQMVLYALQQRPLNLEDAAGFSIYRVSLKCTLSI
jgi:hypothetical protein